MASSNQFPRLGLRSRLIGIVSVGVALVGGCAGSVPAQSMETGERRAVVRHASDTYSPPRDNAIATSLDELGETGQAFHAHVTTLSNPFFEGRGPGTPGIEHAADYLEFYFETYGLRPAFESVETTPDGTEIISPGGSFRQPFEVQGKTLVEEAKLSWRKSGRGADLAFGEEFTPLGFSGDGEMEAPVVFVGYSVAEGPDGYSSFDEDDDLEGKIALMLRFEPMDEEGESLWSEDEGWTANASLLRKMEAAEERGAAGFILVNAPGAADPRAEELMTVENSSFRFSAEKPAAMVSREAADAMVRAMDPQGRSLMELRRVADAGDSGALELDGAVRLTIDLERERIVTDNVGAVLPGKGDLADEYIVIGAHYDHLGYGGRGSRSPEHRGEIHAGADDNASGTSGVLILADRMSREYERMPEGSHARSVLFLAFSAEEMGLLGARRFVEEPSIPLEHVNIMFNMDMIGRLDDQLEINGVGTAEGLEAMLEPLIREQGMRVKSDQMTQVGADLPVQTNSSGYAPTDQTVFVQQDIPVLGFFTGLHREYHTVFDVASTINHAGAVRVLDLVHAIAMETATMPERLVYVETSPRMQQADGRRPTVRLGIMPAGYGEDAPGVGVGDVFEGTTADVAGLKKGDRIIKWGDDDLPGAGVMMAKLRDHEPGDRVAITVLRDGEEVELELVMQARKEDP